MATVKVLNPITQACSELPVPDVFNAPIRRDIVQFVHTNVNKNHRYVYAVSPYAGVQCTAASWGPGRAVARVPRKHGGIGAYANSVRGGHMYSPLTTQRRLHRPVNKNMRRYAIASAIAASAHPSFVYAHGHRVDQVQSFPIVIDCGNVTKTKDAFHILQTIGLKNDIEAVKNSRALRAGVGKLRNRRHTQKLGPLVVYGDEDVEKGFRNIPGVQCCHVSGLNLLRLAPGGTMGRCVVWTKSAFAGLNAVYEQKKNYQLPTSIIKCSDMKRFEQSQALSVVTKQRVEKRLLEKKINPYTNKEAMERLNPSY